MKEGDSKVDKVPGGRAKDINGWKVGSLFGDRAFYNGDWLKRAAAAKGGIYGNDAVEAMYPLTKTLAEWRSARRQQAQVHADLPAKDQFPPVNAFWSVTMYDGKTQLLIKNPINRYLINSPMLPGMKKNADGSLTLYIQKDSPGQGQGSQLAAGAGRPHLPGDAPVLAEDSWQPPAGQAIAMPQGGRAAGRRSATIGA
jgi:hypothetical protein